MLLEIDAAQRVVAERAGLAEMPVDPVDVLVALTRLPQRERPGQIVLDRRRETPHFLGRDVGGELERGELRKPENLVRVRAADARDRALVAEQRMQLPTLAARGSRRVGPRPSPRASGPRWASSASSASGVNSQTPARFFLPPSVSTSSPPSANVSRNIGVFGVFAPAP